MISAMPSGRQWRHDGRRGVRIGISFGAALTALMVTLSIAAAPASASQADYDRGYTLGLEAYKYGLPLVVMNKTFRAQTSIDVPNGRGFGPVNRFNHVRNLATAEDRSVVAPNHDTLYSIAWVDLSDQPQVIHVPRVSKKRYFVLPLMSPYTEDFRNLGTVNHTKPGDYALTAPGQQNTPLPKGVHRIKTDYDRVWIIGRTQVFGENDIKNVRKIQDRYSITPLSRYGSAWRPRQPRNPDTRVNDPKVPTGLAYFDALGAELAKFPPPPADTPILGRLAAVGIAPGLKTSKSVANEDTRRGLIDAVAAGKSSVAADLKQIYLGGFLAHNGWAVLPVGNYGTDYTLRAVTTQVGLGALVPEEAVYPLTVTDLTAQSLTGQKRYALHFPASALPPARAFWSLTLYDNDGFFVPNSIDRYLVNDHTDLKYNSDGSLDLFIQEAKPQDPDQARNWLPTPSGGFRLIMRIYSPEPAEIPGILNGNGWRPPQILPCLAPEAVGLCPLG